MKQNLRKTTAIWKAKIAPRRTRITWKYAGIFRTGRRQYNGPSAQLEELILE